jgi:hypothetical protein
MGRAGTWNGIGGSRHVPLRCYSLGVTADGDVMEAALRPALDGPKRGEIDIVYSSHQSHILSKNTIPALFHHNSYT